MRACLAFAIFLLIAIPLAVQPAAAITQMAIPFYTTCDAVYMVPTEASDAFLVEFNDVFLAGTSMETLDIDFPAFADGLHLGPAVASGTMAIGGALGGTSFNVLPFGPVNLAFPSIAQTALETCIYQRTYFYSDTGLLL